MRACDLMKAPVTTVTPDTSVKQAAFLLSSYGFTALPVVDEDKRLIGIVTEADLVRDRFPRDARYRCLDQDKADSISEAAAGAPTTVDAVMTTPVTAMSPGTDVVDLITAMLQSRMRSMPIVDGSRVVGIVTRRDLVTALARDDQAIAADIRRRLRNYGGLTRWNVDVHDGRVVITDEFDDATDRHVATVLAEAVPGVTAVQTIGPQDQVYSEHGRS